MTTSSDPEKDNWCGEDPIFGVEDIVVAVMEVGVVVEATVASTSALLVEVSWGAGKMLVLFARFVVVVVAIAVEGVTDEVPLNTVAFPVPPC
jgi:hypothetical protein